MAAVRNVKDALALSHKEFPPLAVLRKDFGSQKVEIIIKLYLAELCELVNLKRSLTERQIDVIAAEVVAAFWQLTIADIHVIFRMARNGDFGEMYEALDVPKVMKWFRDYFSERCEAAAYRSERESERNYDKGGNITSERMSYELGRLEKKMSER